MLVLFFIVVQRCSCCDVLIWWPINSVPMKRKNRNFYALFAAPLSLTFIRFPSLLLVLAFFTFNLFQPNAVVNKYFASEKEREGGEKGRRGRVVDVVLLLLNGCSLTACRCLTYVMIPKLITDANAARIRWASQNLVQKPKQQKIRTKSVFCWKLIQIRLIITHTLLFLCFCFLLVHSFDGRNQIALNQKVFKVARCKQHLTNNGMATDSKSSCFL